MYKQTADWLLRADTPDDPARRTGVVASMEGMGFPDPEAALSKWESVVEVVGRDFLSEDMLAFLLATMSQTAAPETSLRNFFRCVCNWNQPAALFALLEQRPRAIEMLVRLFVNSQFLTELLLKHPEFLERLTESRQLSKVRDRGEFLQDMRKAASDTAGAGRFDAVRHIQRWEVLRIAACDCFGLMDLKRVTLQLSLLADATVQALLELLVEANREEGVSVDSPAAPAGFAVLALGKLGGEELNYSSDIDLVFLGDSSAMDLVRIGQRLVRELGKTTTEGFLYRVDMRLRPWGSSGPLVCDVAAYREYLDTQASPWEMQAMVKARVIAGDMDLGNAFLADVNRRLVEYGKSDRAQTVREMKRRIEVALPRRGRDWAEVKSGVGSIRDIEFVTQYLQLRHAQDHPEILDTNTLRSLTALASAGCLRSDEYRKLSTGYLLLRAIEHSLQLMHNKQVHTLPEDDGELTYLARRLDFPDAEQFVTHYVEHSREIREVFERILGGPSADGGDRTAEVELTEPYYLEVYDSRQRAGHQRLLAELERFGSVVVEPVRLEDGGAEVTIVAFDGPGLLSAICGLLVVHGVDIVSGHVVTIDVADGPSRCVDTFQVTVPDGIEWDVLWTGYHGNLVDHMDRMKSGQQEEAFACLTRSVADHVPRASEPTTSLLPVEIEIDNETSVETTVLTIRADDTTGFLYECAHALSLAGISIRRVVVETRGKRVCDRLEVVDKDGGKLRDPQRLQELKTMVVLIKHFTHLLPHSPNPERALRQFRELLVGLLKQDDWTTRVASLEDPKVLAALARVLGVSEFLWQDCLRLQHENLFPLLADVEAVRQSRARCELEVELRDDLDRCETSQDRVDCLNAFKDREMFVADMRHIAWPGRGFGQFSAELGDLAEIVVAEALELCCRELGESLGMEPPAAVAICGLGKFGGQELGFASDIELVCVYDDSRPSGSGDVSAAEFYRRVMARLPKMIVAHRAGVFELDLRLRPHGQAGPLASSVSAFAAYYHEDGPAWPFERQSLVKLRAVAGDPALGRKLEGLRDQCIYRAARFDVAAMRAMRDRQVRQLVRPGTFNAKLSPGALVDIEYFVQGLQLVHGGREADLRTTNTLQAIDTLGETGIVDQSTWQLLRAAYVFQRRLIDALRVVRGDARDLAVPSETDGEFPFLERRLGCDDRLAAEIEQHSRFVDELVSTLELSTS